MDPMTFVNLATAALAVTGVIVVQLLIRDSLHEHRRHDREGD